MFSVIEAWNTQSSHVPLNQWVLPWEDAPGLVGILDEYVKCVLEMQTGEEPDVLLDRERLS